MELNTNKILARRIASVYAIEKSEIDPLDDIVLKGFEEPTNNLLSLWKAAPIDDLLKAFGSDSIQKSGRSGLVPKRVAIKGPDGNVFYAIRWIKPEEAKDTEEPTHPEDEHSKKVNEVLSGHDSARQKIKKLVDHGIYDHKQLTGISPNDGHFVRKTLKDIGVEPKEFEGHAFDDEGRFKPAATRQGGFGAVPAGRAISAGEQAINGDLDDEDRKSLGDEYGITQQDMWDNYNFAMDMLFEEGSPKSILVYGTGGVGKTYDCNKKLKQHGMRKFEQIETVDDEGNIVMKDPPKDSYDYILLKGAMSTSDIWSLIVKHRDKTFIVDDMDSIWRGGDGNPLKNIFKGMLDSTGDGEVTYSGQVTYDEEGKKLPKTIKFHGKVIMISNLPRTAFPQPLVDSRCNAMDLTMTMEETVDKLNSIKNFVEPTNEKGEALEGITQQDKDRAMDFINEFQGKMDTGQVNGRTLAKLMVISKRCRQAGEDDRTFVKRAIHYQDLHKRAA